MLVRVISDLELGRPGPGNADTAVGSLVVGKEQVDRHWSDPLAVGCQPTPGLSSQDFPLSALQVHEIKPEAIGMGITSLVDAGSIVAAEVGLQVAENIIASKFVRDLEAKARVLRRGAQVAHTPVRGVGEQYGCQRGNYVALRIRHAINVFEIHEATNIYDRVVDPEGAHRLLFWFAFFLNLLSRRLLLNICSCMFHGRLESR